MRTIAFITLLLCSTLPAAERTQIPLELIFGNPQKASAKISPDGTKLAYLAPDARGVLNVWIQEAGQEATPLTKDPKRPVRRFLWHYDSAQILYIQDRDGDENWHLYRTDLATRTTTDLTPFDGAKASPLHYDPATPNGMLVAINKRDPSLFDVYQLNLQSGALTLDTTNPGGVYGWIADHNGVVRIALSCTAEANTSVSIRDGRDTPWRELMQLDTKGASDIAFAPDNNSLYMIASKDFDTERLLQVDCATGAYTVLATDNRYDLGGIMTNPCTHALEAISVERDMPGWLILDESLTSDFTALHAALKSPFSIASRTLDDRTWIVCSLSDVNPAAYYRYDRATQKATRLFHGRPGLLGYTLAPMRPISYTARDGMELYSYLTLPPGEEARNLPTVLVVHGGPNARDTWGYDPEAQWMANRGYAVLQINFRGSTGYGKAYVDAGDKEWGRKMHTDLLDGKAWLIEKGIADPTRVAIYGGSYGGYATLAALAFTPDEFCCGIDLVGISSLITFLQTTPPYWEPFLVIEDRRLGNLEKDADMLRERSPLFKAHQITKPLLIAQGANDPRVKRAESDQIVAIMREKGLPVEYILFEDEGHGFARPENRLKFYKACEAFLKQHLAAPVAVAAS